VREDGRLKDFPSFLRSGLIDLQVAIVGNPEDSNLLALAAQINKSGLLNARDGNYELALEFFEIASKGIAAVLGINHGFYADVIENIGTVQMAQCMYLPALRNFHVTRNIRKKLLDENDYTLATIERRLGEVYGKLGESQHAITHYETSIRICRESIGKEKEMAEMLEDLARLHHAIGQYHLALVFYVRALELRVSCTCTGDGIGNLLNNLAVNLVAMDLRLSAINVLQVAKVLYESEEDPNLTALTTTMRNIGILTSELGDPQTAIIHLWRALEIQLHSIGEVNADTANTLCELGTAFGRSENYLTAVRLYELALLLGSRYSESDNRRVWLDNLYQNLEISRSKLRNPNTHHGKPQRVLFKASCQTTFRRWVRRSKTWKRRARISNLTAGARKTLERHMSESRRSRA
jgi:tetratricopeptide (TPR) repeat protein